MSHRFLGIVLLVGLALAASAFGAEPGSTPQLFHNEDSTNFFFFQTIPPGQAGATIDRYVDVMAEAGVTVFLCNTNSRRTNYRSDVWDAYWDGYDPAGSDDQPFLAPIPRGQLPNYRRLIGAMQAVAAEGIDYPARVIERCRHDGVSPWITLRMNDCHYNDMLDHPFHGTFWKKNPQWYRQNCSGYFARCLDYAHAEVRDYYRALTVETLDRYDIDGLELDFQREPYLFSAGKEAEGRPILTAWIREIRRLVAEASARRGHPIRLGVRVPSRAQTSFDMGLDAIAWAQEGLIDVLVATPRWATLEFNMPMDDWRSRLAGTSVTLAGGLEVLYRPSPGGAASTVTPELATGAAMSVLSGGADTVYLFNYFQHGPPEWQAAYREMLQAMRTMETLRQRPRRVAVTYRDIVAPGENYQPPLPSTGKEHAFSLRLGPLPHGPAASEVLLEIATPSAAAPAVSVNGQACEPAGDTATPAGHRVVTYRVPPTALAATEVHQLEVRAADEHPLTLHRIELAVAPAP